MGSLHAVSVRTMLSRARNGAVAGNRFSGEGPGRHRPFVSRSEGSSPRFGRPRIVDEVASANHADCFHLVQAGVNMSDVKSVGWKLPRERAIPKLARLYGGRVYGLGLRLCGKREDAEDLVQETFLRAFRSWDQFEGRSDPGTWLFTIATRTCRRLHRRRAGEPRSMASYEELIPNDALVFGAPPPAPEGLDELVRRESIEQVEQAITGLPVSFRLPLVLKEIAGFSIADVAAILGIRPATVKTRVHRGRLRIRQALERTLPKRAIPLPPYSRQVCLDLLHAKQEALDHGAEMPMDAVCDRCRAVFATLDLGKDLCRELGAEPMPDGLLERILSALVP